MKGMGHKKKAQNWPFTFEYGEFNEVKEIAHCLGDDDYDSLIEWGLSVWKIIRNDDFDVASIKLTSSI